ncbi:MAG: hypothetical protein QG666_1409 [Euryarchaeota archaeon]|nr:hypothetical protein [Euryarchaeota archaeon]
MSRHLGFLALALLIISTFVIAGTDVFVPVADGKTPQNLTEHSWIYNQGTIDDMRIYQSEAGYHGQKLVTGTRGTGTVSRSIDASVYGGFEDGFNEISANEWGVFQNRPAVYSPPITKSELRNALCAKNYEVGSVYSESYTGLVELIKDTTVIQTGDITNGTFNSNDGYKSVYNIHSEVEGTAKVGARVQKSSSSVPIYVMNGVYSGYTNMRMSLETGNASVMALPCP